MLAAALIDSLFQTVEQQVPLQARLYGTPTVSIAEGIEDPAQLWRLRTLGCECGQGFLFSRPQSRENTEVLLNDWSSTWAAALGTRASSG